MAAPEETRPTYDDTATAATGDPAVDEALDLLRDLDNLPIDARRAVFEAAHERLRALLTPGSGEPAGA